MGSSSRSQTQANQQTTNVQDIDTTTIGLEDVETGIVGNSGPVSITQISTDGGAVEAGRRVGEASLDFAGDFGENALHEAFKFGSESLGTVEKGLNAALDFGGDAFDFSSNNLDRSFDFGEKALSTIATIQSDSSAAAQKSIGALAQSLGTVGALSRSDTSDSLVKIIPWIAGALGLGAVAFAFRRG